MLLYSMPARNAVQCATRMVNLSNIRVAFGERVIFDNGDFLLRPGDKVGLVGPNGAGRPRCSR